MTNNKRAYPRAAYILAAYALGVGALLTIVLPVPAWLHIVGAALILGAGFLIGLATADN